MVEAAEAGDRGAMVYMGRAFETGDGLGTLRLETIQFILFWKSWHIIILYNILYYIYYVYFHYTT